MESRVDNVAALATLVAGRVVSGADVVVRDVTHDSRQAGPGTLFVAVPGSTHDGHDFVVDAVAAGSPAVMVEHSLKVSAAQIVVPDTRQAMGPVAAAVHGWPTERLKLVGVTGTNGKTTVTHLVEAMVTGAGRASGLIGTVHTRVGAHSIPNTRTTPEATDFQRLIARMADAGAEIVAAEVSSHALALGRVDAAHFAVVAFTNLTQDHLDFHGDMESYFAAKAQLFDPQRAEMAVVNVDDPAGRRLIDMLDIPFTSVGVGGDVSVGHVESGVESSRFEINTPVGGGEVVLPMGGRINVDNAALAVGCALAVDVTLADAVDALASFAGVPGRFEVVSGDDPVKVVVDYAHTPAGISQAIETARAAGARRVVAVFGAGGDRDREKRPRMGAAASAADVVVVTSDNPRSEDPDAIVADVVAGAADPGRLRADPDRRSAIQWAIEQARPGDVVLVLGRGHERGQEIGGRSLPFDDRLVARDALAAVRGIAR
ncbi:UDP-N-acetylmuramoyl-L-alanyl-D-glutamate--2,6-diaminopimelate ligase [soil metagenome]